MLFYVGALTATNPQNPLKVRVLFETRGRGNLDCRQIQVGAAGKLDFFRVIEDLLPSFLPS